MINIFGKEESVFFFIGKKKLIFLQFTTVIAVYDAPPVILFLSVATIDVADPACDSFASIQMSHPGSDVSFSTLPIAFVILLADAGSSSIVIAWPVVAPVATVVEPF